MIKGLPFTLELSHAPLAREVWTFSFSERLPGLLVQSYAKQTRATKRHRWINVQYYSRFDPRKNTLSPQQVPLPSEIEAEALKRLISLIKIGVTYDE